MKVDEKEVASIIRLSRNLSKEDVDEFNYLRHVLAKLNFEMNLKKEKLIELTELEVSTEYPGSMTDTTTGFLNFLNNNSDGCTTVNENDIILANKGVEAFKKLEIIIEAIYFMYCYNNTEPMEQLIKNIHERN